jgi:hypothetical protein
MFPFIFEWVWDSGHYIFFGAMWYVVIILTVALTYCLVKAAKDSASGDGHHDGHH